MVDDFIYVIPRERVGPDLAGKAVKAKRTCVSGLIVAQVVSEGLWSLTHSPSGMAVVPATRKLDPENLKAIAGALSGLPIVWNFLDPLYVVQQVNKLDDAQLETFFILVNGYRPSSEFKSSWRMKDHSEWLESEKKRVGASA